MCQNNTPPACDGTGVDGGSDMRNASRKNRSRESNGRYFPNSSRRTGLSNVSRDSSRCPAIHVFMNSNLQSSSQYSHRSGHTCTDAKSRFGFRKFLTKSHPMRSAPSMGFSPTRCGDVFPQKPSMPTVSMWFASTLFACADISSIQFWRISPDASPRTRGSLMSSHANIAGSSLYATPVIVFTRERTCVANRLNHARQSWDVKKSSWRSREWPSARRSPAACAQFTYAIAPPERCASRRRRVAPRRTVVFPVVREAQQKPDVPSRGLDDEAVERDEEALVVLPRRGLQRAVALPPLVLKAPDAQDVELEALRFVQHLLDPVVLVRPRVRAGGVREVVAVRARDVEGGAVEDEPPALARDERRRRGSRERNLRGGGEEEERRERGEHARERRTRGRAARRGSHRERASASIASIARAGGVGGAARARACSSF
eukprot:31088-Pelagococcus_subviridis.AAC.2